MEKFAVDLDAVLDEFEFHEDQVFGILYGGIKRNPRSFNKRKFGTIQYSSCSLTASIFP